MRNFKTGCALKLARLVLVAMLFGHALPSSALEQLDVCAGDNVNLTCYTPEGHSAWLQRDMDTSRLIVFDSKYEEPNSARSAYIFPIVRADVNDSGIYTCYQQRNNLHGFPIESTSLSYKVVVITKPTHIELSSTRLAVGTNSTHRILSVVAEVFTTAYCVIEGANTPATAVLYIDTGSDYRKYEGHCRRLNQSMQDVCAFTFTPLVANHGKYAKCVAVHKALRNATLTDVAQLDVSYAARSQVFAEPRSPVQPGTSVTLFCRSNGRPRPTSIRWYYNDKFLVEGERTFNISNASADVAGEYVCRASNCISAHERWGSYNLSVMDLTIPEVSAVVAKSEPVPSAAANGLIIIAAAVVLLLVVGLGVGAYRYAFMYDSYLVSTPPSSDDGESCKRKFRTQASQYKRLIEGRQKAKADHNSQQPDVSGEASV